MNSRMRENWYPRILKKQGGSFCKGCGRTVYKNKEPKAILDHINNKFINTEANLQILCRSCNRIKNPRKKSYANLPRTFSEMKNLKTEHKLRGWLLKELAEREGSWEYNDARDSSAEKFDCSPGTTSRYIAKLTSSTGILDLVGDFLIFKNNAEVDQWVDEDDLKVEQRQ